MPGPVIPGVELPAAAVAPALILAIILAASGLAKLRAPEAVRTAFAGLRIPEPLNRGWIRAAFPAAEVLLALALLAAPGPAAPAAASLALLLFAAYWLLIRRALGFEAPVACACFGESDDAPVTGRTLARNTVLLVLAAAWWAVSWCASAPDLLVRFSLADWLWLAAGLLGAAVLHLTRHSRGPGEPTELGSSVDHATRLKAAARPDAAHDDAGPGPASGPLSDRGIVPGAHAIVPEGSRLLIHVSPGCASCAVVLRAAPVWARRLGRVRLQLISMAPAEAVRVVAPEPLWPGILPAVEQQEMESLGLREAPSAVLLGGGGEVLAGPAAGAAAVESLVERVVERVD